MRRRRPSVIDLSSLEGERLVAALDGLGAMAHAVGSAVVDLGSRDALDPGTITAMLAADRALTELGGRCVWVTAPPLASQPKLGGLLCTTNRDAALAALGGHPPAARVQLQDTRDRLVVRLAGSLDLAGLPAAQATLDQAQATGEIVLDLSQVTWVDVAGVRALVLFAARCQGAGTRVRVNGAPGQLQRLAERLGWQTHLPGIDTGAAEHPTALRDAISRALSERDERHAWAVIATDLAGRVTHWDDAAEGLYGWTRGEVLGRPITELTVGPNDQHLAHRIMQAVQTDGVWEGEFAVRRKDGGTFLAHVRDHMIEDVGGHPIGLLGISARVERRPPEALQAA